MNPAWRSIATVTLTALAATRAWGQSVTAPRSGIDTQFFDTRVRPQDDFYQYVNGKWLATTDIPSDRPAYGVAIQLYDDAQRALGEIIQEAAEHPDNAPGSDAAKVAALYKSFMDEPRVESLGSQPLADDLSRILAIRSKQEIPALIAHLQQIGVTVPFSVSVHLDGMDSSRYVPDLQQDGLGLPDRDYYLLDDATTLRLIRRQYQTHVAASLKLLGDKNAAAEAAAIVALETRLARPQSPKADVRDPLKTYHRIELEALNSLAAGFDWHRYLMAAGIQGAIDYVIVSEPEYLRAFAQTIAETPLATWKSYFRWHLLSDFSPYLSKAYVDESFAFFGTTLQGIPQNQPRWRRGVSLVDQDIGQGIGRLYVQKCFSEQSKQAAERLVHNLLEAFQQDIGTLAWMSPETRTEALRKLSRITIKIGYPNRWRDYSPLEFRDDDLVGNVMRASSFEFQRSMGKLGKPVDRTEWESAPQTVNAFYSPQMNEIVFPAAILRAPFFDAAVDDAANYGAIGMVIGHEISHAFDDQGSQYDGDGRLRDWWSTADHERFAELTAPLVDEYNGFTPMRGRQVNGELTLNENIADNAGLAIAHKAYWLSLQGAAAPVIDGLSGEQRFFMGFAQAWREKLRDNFAIELLQSDPHAISFVRVIGTLVNQSGFDETFSVKPGDRMYVPPDGRVTIW
jgi:predicted metalloendopeptidase